MYIIQVASLDTILSNKRIKKGAEQSVWMYRLVCAFVVRTPKTGFPIGETHWKEWDIVLLECMPIHHVGTILL